MRRIGLSGPKKVLVTVTRKNGEKKSRLDRPEQKSVAWIPYLVDKFSNYNGLVVGLFSGMFAIAIA